MSSSPWLTSFTGPIPLQLVDVTGELGWAANPTLATRDSRASRADLKALELKLTGERTKELDCGVERSRRATERAHLVSHLCDLFQKRFLGALGRVLDRRFNVEDGETRAAVVGLPSEHATHPLDHLAAGTTGADDHGKVRLRDVDAFVKYPRVARRPAPRMADVVFGDGRDAVWVPQFRIVDRLIAPLQRDVLQRDSA